MDWTDKIIYIIAGLYLLYKSPTIILFVIDFWCGNKPNRGNIKTWLFWIAFLTVAFGVYRSGNELLIFAFTVIFIFALIALSAGYALGAKSSNKESENDEGTNYKKITDTKPWEYR